MLPVAEIAKRRKHLKQTPPGFPTTRTADINNNYSTTAIKSTNSTNANQTICVSTHSNDTQIASNSGTEKADIQSIVRNLRLNGIASCIARKDTHTSQLHMMPVLEVARKRAIHHSVPPGFKQLPILDTNNNAGKSEFRYPKKTATREFYSVPVASHLNGHSRHRLPVHKSNIKELYNELNKSDNAGQSEDRYEAQAKFRERYIVTDKLDGLKDVANPFTGCIKFVKDEILFTPEEIESLKPACLRGNEEDKTNGKVWIVKKAKKEKKDSTFTVMKNKMMKMTKYPEKMKVGLPWKNTKKGIIRVKADVRKDVIGGEEVVVNILTFDPEEENDVRNLEVRDDTPENFFETCEYFEIVSNNRKHVTRLIYTLGDMLLSNEIEGNRDEWKEYADMVYEEEQAWKRRCREDDAFFEKTGQSSGVPKVTWKSQLMRYLKGTVSYANNFLATICPCFFSKHTRLKS